VFSCVGSAGCDTSTKTRSPVESERSATAGEARSNVAPASAATLTGHPPAPVADDCETTSLAPREHDTVAVVEKLHVGNLGLSRARSRASLLASPPSRESCASSTGSSEELCHEFSQVMDRSLPSSQRIHEASSEASICGARLPAAAAADPAPDEPTAAESQFSTVENRTRRSAGQHPAAGPSTRPRLRKTFIEADPDTSELLPFSAGQTGCMNRTPPAPARHSCGSCTPSISPLTPFEGGVFVTPSSHSSLATVSSASCSSRGTEPSTARSGHTLVLRPCRTPEMGAVPSLKDSPPEGDSGVIFFKEYEASRTPGMCGSHPPSDSPPAGGSGQMLFSGGTDESSLSSSAAGPGSAGAGPRHPQRTTLIDERCSLGDGGEKQMPSRAAAQNACRALMRAIDASPPAAASGMTGMRSASAGAVRPQLQIWESPTRTGPQERDRRRGVPRRALRDLNGTSAWTQPKWSAVYGDARRSYGGRPVSAHRFREDYGRQFVIGPLPPFCYNRLDSACFR